MLGKYLHFKGKEYEVLCIAKECESLEEMVVYRALYGDGEVWVRPSSVFFEEVVLETGQRCQRFTKMV